MANKPPAPAPASLDGAAIEGQSQAHPGRIRKFQKWLILAALLATGWLAWRFRAHVRFDSHWSWLLVSQLEIGAIGLCNYLLWKRSKSRSEQNGHAGNGGKEPSRPDAAKTKDLSRSSPASASQTEYAHPSIPAVPPMDPFQAPVLLQQWHSKIQARIQETESTYREKEQQLEEQEQQIRRTFQSYRNRVKDLIGTPASVPDQSAQTTTELFEILAQIAQQHATDLDMLRQSIQHMRQEMIKQFSSLKDIGWSADSDALLEQAESLRLQLESLGRTFQENIDRIQKQDGQIIAQAEMLHKLSDYILIGEQAGDDLTAQEGLERLSQLCLARLETSRWRSQRLPTLNRVCLLAHTLAITRVVLQEAWTCCLNGCRVFSISVSMTSLSTIRQSCAALS